MPRNKPYSVSMAATAADVTCRLRKQVSTGEGAEDIQEHGVSGLVGPLEMSLHEQNPCDNLTAFHSPTLTNACFSSGFQTQKQNLLARPCYIHYLQAPEGQVPCRRQECILCTCAFWKKRKWLLKRNVLFTLIWRLWEMWSSCLEYIIQTCFSQGLLKRFSIEKCISCQSHL